MSVANNNLYTMSDDDFLNADPDTLFAEAPREPLNVSDDQEDADVADTVENDVEVDTEALEDTNEPETLDETDEIEEDTPEDTSEPEEDFEEVEESDEDTEEESEDTEPQEESEEEVEDEESEANPLDEVLAPLNHKGSEFTPKDVAEVRRLMSMGLDYARKMQGMKEQRKYLKMLDKNELLDESKLSFAIDLIKGNKDAIAKLVQDHKVDTLDLDEDGKYTPSNYAVSDNEVELDEAIESIRSTATFSDTMNIVSNWDESSKRALTQQPQLLGVLNEHKANGIYAMVQERVQRERILGGYVGLSDVEAYQAAGDALHKEGAFNSEPEKKPAPKRVVRKPQPKAEDKQLQEKRRKASPNKGNPKKTNQKKEYDFWNMSEEDFEKFKF
ncbi:tape measure protein [Vibrio phage vB_VhaP_PG11]|nr:tape measure protein [Vibrio phage vB_VhaP_PG11]